MQAKQYAARRHRAKRQKTEAVSERCRMHRKAGNHLCSACQNHREPQAHTGSSNALRLCRKESLHPQLCFCGKSGRWCDEKFYAPHRRQQNPLHNDDCIYTPGVIAFKSDTTYPKLLPEDKWCSVNVLTCAAPNLRERPSNSMNPNDGNTTVRISQKELQALHEKRMRKVLDIAWKNGNEVVILGAFGCGAFSNPPLAVAQAMKAVVQEYRMKFETIEFAVYCSPRDDSNFRIFQNVLGKL